MVASLGVGELPVLRQPQVAFFSNGDELRSIGQPLALGEVYDSNRYTLHGMLTRAGVTFNDLGVVPDDREQIQNTFLRAASMADVVITSAGASVGDADYVKEVLDEIGEVNFWKIAMKLITIGEKSHLRLAQYWKFTDAQRCHHADIRCQ